MDALAYAIVGHLVGDYLAQNDWVATNKKKSSWVCWAHCLMWACCVCTFAWWLKPTVFAILVVTHFVQDRGTLVSWLMRTCGQRQFAQPPMAPWSIIVVDNVLHLVVIALCARLYPYLW